MRAFFQDIRYAVRQLRRSPGFAITAVVTLALGIGAVTSVFSVVESVLLKPFAFRDPGRLVVIRESVKELAPVLPDNYLHYLRLRAQSKTLQDAAIFQDHDISVSTSGDHPQLTGGLAVSANFFSVLGVQPMLGRSFRPEETKKGHDQEVILSYAAWQRFFNGDPHVLGHTLNGPGAKETVVGVLPESFRFPAIAMAPGMSSGGGVAVARPYDIFTPLVPQSWALTDDESDFNFLVVGRVKRGISIAQATAELNGLQEAYALAKHFPVHLGISVQPFIADVTGSVSTGFWLLFVAVGGVLLIACVNLANLQLARSVSHQRETAVRAALGAGRGRLVQATLMESLVLAGLGGAIGIFLSFLGVQLFIAAAPANTPRLSAIHVSWPVLLFAAGLSMLTAVLFGLLPALRTLRVDPQSAMQTNPARVANTREGAATRNLLVAAEVACTVVLLVVTGLVVHSFSHLIDQERAFHAGHVTVAQVVLDTPEFYGLDTKTNPAKDAFIDRTLAQLRHLPGVSATAMTSAMPFTGDTWIDGIHRPDHPVPPGQEPHVNMRWVSPGYLSLMHVPVIEGRGLAPGDRNHPMNVVISQKTARDAWPGEDPLGKHFNPHDNGGYTVVGVAADAHINNLKSVSDMVYLPYWNQPPWTISLLVRSAQPTDSIAASIRQTIWKIDPQVAIPVLKSLDAQIGDSVAAERFQTLLLSSFGAAALLLALLGVYGVLAYSVSMRTQEFGIRIALGAGKANLMRLVMTQAFVPVVSGILIGLGGAFLATRWIASLLYETKPADPVAIGVAVALLLAVACLAAVLPARRAAQVDPMQALRSE